MDSKEIIVRYIVQFLLGEKNIKYLNKINYGYNDKAEIIIEKSDFFSNNVYLTTNSLPILPLKTINGIPILYGENSIEKKGNQIIIYADLIASTYFLITRYEECVRHDIRDAHGRFPGKKSVLFEEGYIKRPIADEYGRLLRDCLRHIGYNVYEPNNEISHIYLTHDVDQIWTWDNLYKAIRTLIKRFIMKENDKLLSIKSLYNYKKYDPIYTFPELIDIDNKLKKVFDKKCEDIYFFMGCESKGEKDNGYYNNYKRTENLIKYLVNNDAKIGIHTSYAASKNMYLFKNEKNNIEKILGNRIDKVRNHYLASREPSDFNYYIDEGITDDFTMGYPDIIGFRLGTSRAVRWIDPLKIRMTSLTLHPLTAMDRTLDSKQYMGIENISDAFKEVKYMIDISKKYNGEITLLWHSNSIYRNESYQRDLYIKVINYLKSLSNL